MSFDTTNSNSERKGGAVVLIEKELENKLLYVPCRHQIFDLIVKNFQLICSEALLGHQVRHLIS